jgi:hypothetical protein
MNLRLPSHVVVSLLTAAALVSTAPEARARTGAGLELRKSAQPADLGMPAYPKAVQRGDSQDDSPAVTLGAWAGAFGFHLAVAKFASDDGAPEILAFYRKALAAHGTVLECAGTEGGRPTAGAAAPASRKAGETPSCERDRPGKAGAVVLRVGSDRDFRLVHVEPAGQGSAFHLVRVRASR